MTWPTEEELQAQAESEAAAPTREFVSQSEYDRRKAAGTLDVFGGVRFPGASRPPIPGRDAGKMKTLAVIGAIASLATLRANEQRKRLGLPYAKPSTLARKRKGAGRVKLQRASRRKNRRR